MKSVGLIVKLLLIIAVIGAGCTSIKPTTGIEVTNGNCVGTIYNQDSTVAQGAIVRLIPAGYDPSAPASGHVDSTSTDNNGNYAFMVTESDYYNIIAEKDGVSCMRPSVPVQPNASIVVNDTLEASGKLIGRITVKPEDDPRSVVILIRGTNIYTMPYDSAGNFAAPLLPEGTFTVQIFFTAGSGYTVFDTLISILQGETTELIVTLPTSDAPPVAGLTVDYDSVSMYATLHWLPADTSRIASYTIFRKSAAGHDTMVMIDKLSTSYTDDVVQYEGDTIVYQIAAIGKNYKEGYRSGSETVVPWSNVPYMKSISLQYDGSTYFSATGIRYLYIDRVGNFYTVDDVAIQKMDTNGVRMSTYLDTSGYSGIGNLQSDDEENLYWLKHPSSNFDSNYVIVKFDHDLNVVIKLNISTIMSGGNKYKSLVVTGNGTLFFIIDSTYFVETISGGFSVSSCSRHIRVYDNQLNKKDDYYIESQRYIEHVARFGDTIVTKQVFSDLTTVSRQIDYYDLSFNYLGSFENIDFLNRCVPSSMEFVDGLFSGVPDGGPDGLIVSYALSKDRFRIQNETQTEHPLLLIANQQKQLLSRRMINPYSIFNCPEIYFDHAGNFYGMQLFKGTVTIFKYSMERLFSGKTP